jgi:hypothetical protein
VGLVVLFAISFLSLCLSNQQVSKTSDDCATLGGVFDLNVVKFDLPGEENLCSGLTVSDAASILPLWAGGALLEIQEYGDWSQGDLKSYQLSFKGSETTGEIWTVLKTSDAASLESGKFYKINLMDNCRYFLVMADGSSEPAALGLFNVPEQLNCE